MKSIFKLLTIVPVAAMMSFTSSCNRIDAGHAGIKVKLYGSKKGVQDVTAVTGTVFFNPITERVYEVPTFVQNVKYTREEDGKSETNEEFRVTTKDGLTVSFDVSMNYFTPDSSVTYIFKKYRKTLSHLERGVIRLFLIEEFNDAASNYTAEELYEKRMLYVEEASNAAKKRLLKEGFIVEQLTILNEMRLPESVVKNIQAKVNATQIANKKTQEIAQAIADASKLVEAARGDSLSAVIRAAGVAQANKMLEKSYSDEVLRAMWIEAWREGGAKVPQYIAGQTGGQFMLQMK